MEEFNKLKFLATCFGIALASNCHATPSVAPHQKDLNSVRSEIKVIQNEIANKEESKKATFQAIQASEQAIEASRRALNQLKSQQQQSVQELEQLQAQLESSQAKVQDLTTRIDQMLVRQYESGKHDAIQVFLNGQNPNQSSRDLTYYQYIAKSQQQLITGLKQEQEKLLVLTDTIETKLAELGFKTQSAQNQQNKLSETKSQHEDTANKLAAEISAKQSKLRQLKQNEQRLSHLIDVINRQIAAAKREAARKAALAKKQRELAAKREAEKRRLAIAKARKENKPIPKEKPSKIVSSQKSERIEAEASSSSSFRQQRGKMGLPVSGSITAQYGSRREEGSSWKGIFIRTNSGQIVHTVAAGRVVYASQLRGFGNTVIVDHGGYYMTVYTGMGGISVGTGQNINAGQTIGTTGIGENSNESGLYFELRYMGKPINPMTWVR